MISSIVIDRRKNRPRSRSHHRGLQYDPSNYNATSYNDTSFVPPPTEHDYNLALWNVANLYLHEYPLWQSFGFWTFQLLD